jgi:hypothetical protein
VRRNQIHSWHNKGVSTCVVNTRLLRTRVQLMLVNVVLLVLATNTYAHCAHMRCYGVLLGRQPVRSSRPKPHASGCRNGSRIKQADICRSLQTCAAGSLCKLCSRQPTYASGCGVVLRPGSCACAITAAGVVCSARLVAAHGGAHAREGNAGVNVCGTAVHNERQQALCVMQGPAVCVTYATTSMLAGWQAAMLEGG